MPSPLPACLLPLWLAPNTGSWSLLLAQQPLTAENQSGLCLRGTVPTGKPSQPLEALRADTFPAPSSYSADFHPAALLFQAEVAWLPPWEPSQGSPGQKAACLPARVLDLQVGWQERPLKPFSLAPQESSPVTILLFQAQIECRQQGLPAFLPDPSGSSS